MNKIIIDGGVVHIPKTVQMRDFEIAQLFEVFQQAVKANIRSILKSGIVTEEFAKGGIVTGNRIIPEYFGLDMVIALSFRVQSRNADTFRKWIMAKTIDTSTVRLQPVIAQMPSGQLFN